MRNNFLLQSYQFFKCIRFRRRILVCMSNEKCNQKNILSIDGGGIKGIFAASFLSEIEKKCCIKICDYFDMISGTSTGAIIAAALSIGIPAEKIFQLYRYKANKIFPSHTFFKIFRGKYKTNELKQALQDVFGEKKIRDCQTRLLIPAYNLVTRKVQVFKTPHAEDLYYDYNLLLLDVILSSTAAPIYFSPYEMPAGVFIDGGVGANNPSFIAVAEGLTRCHWQPENINVLSIGNVGTEVETTGKEKMGLIDALTIQKCFMAAESQYAENLCNIFLNKKNILRIDYNSIHGQVSLDKVNDYTINTLRTWGVQEAQKYVHTIQEKFLSRKKEDIKFYNII